MKRQNSASFVSRSFFLSSDFSVSRLFPLPDAFLRMAGSGKVFGLNTLRRRKILPETALPPDLIAASGMNLNYTIGCRLCHKKQKM